MALEIGVDSPLELYTTMIGWQIYNDLWFLAIKSGIVFLPFLVMVVRSTLSPIEAYAPNAASITSLKMLEINIISALVVVLLAAQPSIPLSTSAIKFHLVCETEDNANFETKTKTSLEDDQSIFKQTSFGIVTSGVKIPPWWYGVLSVSSGLTLAAKSSLPCKEDSRMQRFLIDSSSIKSADFIAEVSRFIHSCYWPARHYIANRTIEREKLKDLPKGSPIAEVEAKFHAYFDALVAFEKADSRPEWIGWRPYIGLSSKDLAFKEGLTEISKLVPVGKGGGTFQGVYDFIETQDKSHFKFGESTFTRAMSCSQWWGGSEKFKEMVAEDGSPFIGMYQQLKEEVRKNNPCLLKLSKEGDTNYFGNFLSCVPTTYLSFLRVDREKLLEAKKSGNAAQLASLVNNAGYTEEDVLSIWMTFVIETATTIRPPVFGQNIADRPVSSVPDSVAPKPGDSINYSDSINTTSESSVVTSLRYFTGMFAFFTDSYSIIGVREGLPVAQAFILMVIYVLLPLGLIFASFDIGFMVNAAVGIMVLKFMSYAFFLATWVDNFLFESISFENVLHGADVEADYHYKLIALGALGLFPAMFVMVISWSGFVVVSQLQQFLDQAGGFNAPVNQAATKIPNMALSAGGGLLRKGQAILDVMGGAAAKGLLRGMERSARNSPLFAGLRNLLPGGGKK